MIKRYNHLIFNKILLVYGREKAGKKYKERTLVFVLMPFVSVFIGFVLYFCSVGIASSFCCTAGLYAAACFLYDINIVKKAKRRCISMKFELADIIDRIAILLDAGVTLWSAAVIVSELSDNECAMTRELQQTVRSFCSSGGYYYEPEAAFEDMARRCDDPSVSTFVSLIVQNSRKGTEELAGLLRMHSINSRNERRMLAKQLSDEASTLMLIPSVLVLAAVLALVAAPAIIQFL